MKTRHIKKLLVITAMIMFFSFPVVLPVNAETVNEQEPNSGMVTATATADDNNNYGTLSSNTDTDWWKITFNQTGLANFWLGGFPSNCNYDICVRSGSEVVATSTDSRPGKDELCRVRVYTGVTYYVQVFSSDSTFVSAQYLMRVKRYDLNDAKTFTFNTTLSGGINTRGAAAEINPYFRNMGFTTGEFLNNHAKTCYIVMPQCDVLVVPSSGAPGQMTFYCAGGTDTSYLYANKTVSDTSLNRSLSSLNTDQIAQIDLAIFCGSYTGVSTSDGWNMVDIAREKGAFCAIGWLSEVDYEDSEIWLQQFTLNLYRGDTVFEAIENTNRWFELNTTNNSNINDIYYGSSKVNSLTLL